MGEPESDVLRRLRQVIEANQRRGDGASEASNDGEIASRPANEVEADRGQSPEAQAALTHLEKRREAEIDRLDADNRRRWWFFWFVIAVTAVPVLVSSGVMARIAWDGEVAAPVLVAFFASVVVEVIGLSIIVANYLFPKNGSLKRNDEIDVDT